MGSIVIPALPIVIPALLIVIPALPIVIPAKAGIHRSHPKRGFPPARE